MNHINEFDKSFKERINQMDFEYKEDYWEEMDALLNDKKKKRRALFWWTTSISVASIVFALVLFFMNSKANNYISENNSKGSKQPFKTHEKLRKNTEKQQINKNTFPSGINKNESASALINNKDSQITHAKAVTPKSFIPKPNLVETKNMDSKQTFLKEEEITKPMIMLESDKTLQQNFEEMNYAITKNDQLKKILSQKEHFNKLDFEKNEFELAKFSMDSIKKSNWMSHVGLIAGSNFGRSFKSNGQIVGGLGTNIGLRFYYSHRKGFQINTGLSFGINAIDGLTYLETKKVFGFAQYDLVNTIYYKSMFTANVPIYIGYEGLNFSISGGLRLNYIMNTRGVVHTWDNSIINQNIWGYAHGIKHFNMAAGIESSFRISRRIDLGISLDVDLSPRSEENNNLISPVAQLWQSGVFVKYKLN